MLVLKDIGKSYNKFRINDFSLKIEKGEFVTLLGESGCGKTTLLKIISGIIEDYSGEIYIDGEDVRGKSTKEKGLSMVFQDSLLLPNLNVEDNVAFGLKIMGLPKKDRIQRAREVLEELGLKGFEKRHPYDLSGGQRQRVSIARALVMEPKLLLMDEPFSALDENLRGKLQKMLKSIQRKYRSTILFVTHDRNEAFYLSDKIAIMDSGSLVQFDTPKNLYENPISTFAARFLGINNIFSGEIKKGIFYSGNIRIPVAGSDNAEKVSLALKSEDLRVTLEGKPGDVEGILKGRVKDSSFKSGFYYFDLDIGGESIEVVQNRVEFDIENHMELYVRYNKNNIILI
ncbi:ABC transporter ATP-binding protein [uncultured Ilyobacter sp.]|uniref:ABC transporter ATP-binding protein n=1 Tax=uncultured Ilyobacter sp. TaxID=544433 RepID=UPI0029C77F5B|nr:ABC transporter ATP-binding protein [uncultured Ilyobacter sp.]